MQFNGECRSTHGVFVNVFLVNRRTGVGFAHEEIFLEVCLDLLGPLFERPVDDGVAVWIFSFNGLVGVVGAFF